MIGKTFDRICAMKNMATNKERKLIEGLEKIEPDELVYMSITELASRLNVAEATVVRFCKKLGYNGFQDFKLSLSKELGTSARPELLFFLTCVIMTCYIYKKERVTDERENTGQCVPHGGALPL